MVSILFSGFSRGKRETFNRAAESLRHFMDGEGIRISPSSRLALYGRAISQPNECHPRNASVLRQALLEIDDFRLIVQELSSSDQTGWRGFIQQLLAGKVLPEEENAGSFARNKQFELLTAALLRRAGFNAVLREPDICVTSTQPPFSIAVKRPLSRKNFRHLVRDAQKQIARALLPGVLAIDVSRLINPRNGYLASASFKTAHFQVSELIAQVLIRDAPGIRKLINPTQTFAVAFYMAILVEEESSGEVGYVRIWKFANMCEPDDPRWRMLQAVAERVNVASFLRTG